MSESVIRTESLTKRYGRVVGVEDLGLEVRRGEVFGFLGPNGAGKTTTIRLLMGLLRPTRGTASVLGLDCWRQSVQVKGRVGYLPGEGGLYTRLTGAEHIRFIAGFHGGGDDEALALALRLELDAEQLARKVGGYSRGMKQKLAVVLALMSRPALLIMDEPTNGLDPITQHELYEILNEFRRDGTTTLFSSHNLPEVERICDRVGIIKEGRLVATERIEDLGAKRLRNVEVVFSGPPPPGLAGFPGVSGFEVQAPNRAQFKFRGDADALLKELASHPIADFSVTHASLEDLFLEFYEKGGPPAAAPGGGAG
jgi:ABC-2 type transport system ATP-binding protein